jgi:hypothetical protein
MHTSLGRFTRLTVLAIAVTFMMEVGAACAEVDTHSGNYWLTLCTTNPQTPEDEMLCLGYIEAVIDYNDVMNALGGDNVKTFCEPKNVTLGQMQEICVMIRRIGIFLLFSSL